MRGWIKIGVVAGAGVLLMVLLLVAWAGAGERGRLRHCRNNLRHLAMLMISNAQLVDPEVRGTAFWHEVREIQYKTIKGEEMMIEPDPFLCPVYGKTEADRNDPKAIDYLGPAYDPSAPESGWAIGADKARNHRPAHVVFFDTGMMSVDPLRLETTESPERKDLRE